MKTEDMKNTDYMTKNDRTNFLNQVNSRLKIIDEAKETKKKIRRAEFISLEIPVIQKRILELIELHGRTFQMIYSPKPIYLVALSYVEIKEILENELEGFVIMHRDEDDYYRISLKDSSFQE